MTRKYTRSPFPDADHDRRTHDKQVERANSPQTLSPSYRLAFADMDFLTRRELRGTRLLLEMQKAELLQQEHGIASTVVVFGSARLGEDNPWYQTAREFGRLVSQNGSQKGRQKHYVVTTGGGPGIMEAANRGAAECGADTVGLSIVLPHEQAPNPYVTPDLSFNFHYFAIRKMHFLIRAEALACFPGGFGTLDELFEALTLIQTRKITPMPVILFGESWWKRLINFDMLVEEGTIARKDLDILNFVETAEEGWEVIRKFYETHPHHKRASDREF